MALRVEVVNHLTEHLLTLIAIPGSHIHAFQEIFLSQVSLAASSMATASFRGTACSIVMVSRPWSLSSTSP